MARTQGHSLLHPPPAAALEKTEAQTSAKHTHAPTSGNITPDGIKKPSDSPGKSPWPTGTTAALNLG